MKPFRIKCECGKVLRITRAEQVGRKIKCPECRQSVLIKQPNQRGARTKQQRKSAADSKGTSVLLAAVGSFLVVGLIGGVVLWMLSGRGGEPDQSESSVARQSEPGNSPPPAGGGRSEPGRQNVDPDSPEGQAVAAVRKMVSMIKANRLKDFFLKHGPKRDAEALKSLIAKGTFPGFRDSDKAKLLEVVEPMLTCDSKANADGSEVQFFRNPGPPERANVGDLTQRSGVAKFKNEGYGEDLDTVLRSAVRDLESGQYKRFVERMFPPATYTEMMAATDNSLPQFTKSDPRIVRMIADLKKCRTVTPKELTPDTMEFRIRVDPDASWGRLKPVTVPIRFSKFKGHWRFYENLAGLRGQMAQSATQPLEDLASDMKPVTLIRDGETWRLEKMPPRN